MQQNSRRCTKELQTTGEIVTLSFIGNSSGEPALAVATKRFQVYPNILSGNITQLKHEAYGKLIIHMQGNKMKSTVLYHFTRTGNHRRRR